MSPKHFSMLETVSRTATWILLAVCVWIMDAREDRIEANVYAICTVSVDPTQCHHGVWDNPNPDLIGRTQGTGDYDYKSGTATDGARYVVPQTGYWTVSQTGAFQPTTRSPVVSQRYNFVWQDDSSTKNDILVR